MSDVIMKGMTVTQYWHYIETHRVILANTLLKTWQKKEKKSTPEESFWFFFYPDLLVSSLHCDYFGFHWQCRGVCNMFTSSIILLTYFTTSLGSIQDYTPHYNTEQWLQQFCSGLIWNHAVIILICSFFQMFVLAAADALRVNPGTEADYCCHVLYPAFSTSGTWWSSPECTVICVVDFFAVLSWRLW